MDTDNMSKIQVIIILLIAGIVSVAALNGLSEDYKDYYVSATLSEAFFRTILWLVLTSPFLYIFRKK